MKIGLSFLPQIRSLLIPSPNPEQLADLTSEDRALKNGGGWIAQQVQEMVSQISTSFGREHNDDDTHSTIHATGSISEYDRSVAQGVWITIPFSACTFAGSATAWTVAASNFSGVGFAYTLVGKTMTLAWNFQSTSVTAGNATLNVTINLGGIHQTQQIFGTFHYSDNGTFGCGLCQVKGATATAFTLTLSLVNPGANWAASVSNTDVRGQITFEIAGI